jgi:hypothetical protein
MKRIVLTLLIFSLSTLGHSATIYVCQDSPQGRFNYITDNPPQGPNYNCISAVYYSDLTPQEQGRREINRRTEDANARIDAAIDSIKNNKANYYKGGGLRPEATDRIIELEKARLRDTRSDTRIGDLINSIKNNPSNSYKSGGLRPEATQQIVDLEKARLRLQEDPQDAGLMTRNQQDDMEDKMKRQQREIKAKTDAMNAEMSRQQAEMQRLQHQQRISEHNQRMNTFFGK